MPGVSQVCHVECRGNKKRGRIRLSPVYYPCDGLARMVIARMGREERQMQEGTALSAIYHKMVTQHTFAKRVFLVAGIYGLAVLFPQYFMEGQNGRDFPPPINHPEYF